MRWSKTLCAQCEHYRACPSKTRLFVNYCGSHERRQAKAIEAAVSDCRSRRRMVVRYRRSRTLGVPREVVVPDL